MKATNQGLSKRIIEKLKSGKAREYLETRGDELSMVVRDLSNTILYETKPSQLSPEEIRDEFHRRVYPPVPKESTKKEDESTSPKI